VQAKFSIEGDELGGVFKARPGAVAAEDADARTSVFFDDGFRLACRVKVAGEPVVADFFEKLCGCRRVVDDESSALELGDLLLDRHPRLRISDHMSPKRKSARAVRRAG
jgi:hypothetical protein